MLSVGLSGNVAAGKSTVAGLWARAGVPVISADELARQAVEPGSSGLEAVRALFGDQVLAPDGEMDRAAVREMVFSNPEARRRLEEIVHPRVWEARAKWLAKHRKEGTPVVVSEIPLLFELGSQDEFDVTVLVDASPARRLGRLMGIRGLTEGEARNVMAAQMDPDQKRELADIVIHNDGSLADLTAQAESVLEELRRRPSLG